MSLNSNTLSLLDEAIVFELDSSWIDAVFELEQACSQNPWSRNVLSRELERSFSLRPGVSLNGQLIAQSFSYLVKDELHILNISVSPEYQGLGLGKMLMRHILELAEKKGAVIGTLEVRESNTVARSLYEGLEFKHVGTRKSYYQNNGEDALVLVRRLGTQVELTSSD